MEKRTKFFIITIIGLFFFMGIIYSIKQSNTMLLQGEVEVKTIDLASKVAGRVEKINFNKGDKVNKDDVIIELNMPEVEAKSKQAQAALNMALSQQKKADNGARKEQIAMAKAQYEVAKKTYNRLQRLHSEGVIPTQKLDEAQAKYTAAKAQYDMAIKGSRIEDKDSAKALVEKALSAQDEVISYLNENKITAPINGIITDITVDEAELIGQGYPIVTLIDENDVWFTFNMREDLLPKIKVGKEIDVKIIAIGNKPIKAKVNYISALGNFATWRATKAKGDFDMKTFEVRLVPTEKIDGLRAGMSVIFDYKKLK